MLGPALTAALPKHTAPPKHHRSLPHGEIAEALQIVDGSARAWPVSKACLRFIVATACRSGEARLARWDEIDRDAETWTVPGERFRSWAAEQGMPREVAEAQLGHVAGKSERAYQRSDLLDARRKVMDDWSDYLSST